MAIFALLGIVPWTPIAGNVGANPNFPPGSLQDLAIRIEGVKQEPDPGCPKDLTGDGEINAADLANLLGKWGPTPPPCPPFEASDFDQDCDVDAADLANLLGAWGPCPP